jgi:WD40 repeat protein
MNEIFFFFQFKVAKFSPDGKLLAVGSRDGIIYMYQVNDKYKKYSRMGRCMVS